MTLTACKQAVAHDDVLMVGRDARAHGPFLTRFAEVRRALARASCAGGVTIAIIVIARPPRVEGVTGPSSRAALAFLWLRFVPVIVFALELRALVVGVYEECGPRQEIRAAVGKDEQIAEVRECNALPMCLWRKHDVDLDPLLAGRARSCGSYRKCRLCKK